MTQHEQQQNIYSGAYLRIVRGTHQPIIDGVRVQHPANIRTANQRIVYRIVYHCGGIVELVYEQSN